MHKVVFIGFLLFLPIVLTTCEHPVEVDYSVTKFVKTFGGSNFDEGRSIQQTTDGGFIIAGTTSSFGNGSSDIWLIKTDAEGNEEWNQTFGGSSSEEGHSVQQTTDGGFIITGTTRSYGNGNADVWLIKTDLEGREEWNRTFGGSDWDGGFFVQQTSDGGFIISGMTLSFGNGGSDVWLVKTDREGKEEWNRTFGESGSDNVSSAQQTVDGGYMITGSSGLDVWLIKTDSAGKQEWQRVIRKKSFMLEGDSFQITSDGGVILTGYTRARTGIDGSVDVWLVKTDREGKEEWNRTFGGSGWDDARSVQPTTDGGYVIVGTTRRSFGNGDFDDVYLIKTDSQGYEQWSRTFGGSGWDVGWSGLQTNDGGFILVGHTQTSENDDTDVWLIKTDSQGNTIP